MRPILTKIGPTPFFPRTREYRLEKFLNDRPGEEGASCFIFSCQGESNKCYFGSTASLKIAPLLLEVRARIARGYLRPWA